MPNIQTYICDTETSGLSLAHHEITEISIIRAIDRVQYSRNIRAYKPENASWDALRITGKSINDLRSGSEKNEVIKEIDDFLKEDGVESTHRLLVCHNVAFDRKFLCALWEQHNRKFPFDLYLDTIHLFRQYCKNQGLIKPKANLTAATELLGIKKRGNSHNAKVDTQHTYLLWEKLSQEIDWLPFAKCLPHNLE